MDRLSNALIERYTLRGLSANETQRVEEHLAGCPECEDRRQEEVELPTATPSSSMPEVRRIVESGRNKAA
jgi:anti-sigma factor RsiW